MNTWPDKEGALFHRYVRWLSMRNRKAQLSYLSVLRRFQGFVTMHTPDGPLSRQTVQQWICEVTTASSVRMAVHRAHTVNGFLNWLVARKYLDANPFAELRHSYGGSTAEIVRGLASPDSEEALAALRPSPRFSSHLGPVMQDHINRMRTLGMRYRHEYTFGQFDRFLAARPGASGEPLNTLVREYLALAPTAAERRRRLSVGRLVAQARRRSDPSAQMPVPYDRVIEQDAKRCRRRPYIYTEEEVRKLLDAARNLVSPHSPFRPITVYTMIVLGYCVGLRVGEIARLTVGDVDLHEGSILIRETKFFKSRQLPLSKSVAAVLCSYLDARHRAGFPSEPDSALFWHEKGPYAYQSVHLMITGVIRQAGLKPDPGRTGPRVHDLRHAFVFHRMMAWYREGVNPQSRLPYLATYLGHRDIHSTLVYLTVTKELLQSASERFRAFGAKVLAATRKDI